MMPKRIPGQAPDLVAKAAAISNSPEIVRFTIVTALIGEGRSFWRGTDEEILSAAGYRDANEYWHVATSEPTKAVSFVHLLVVHLSDPTTSDNSVLERSIQTAFGIARQAGETWFIKDATERGPEDDLDRLMLHPREAALWLLSKPKKRHLVPPSLRAFLAQGGRNELAPAAVPGEAGTGAPGRPTSMHLIQNEFERRCASGTTASGTAEAAKELLDWFRQTYPAKPPPTEKTIKNRLPEWRRESDQSRLKL
jgi:hypothetical protein